MSTRYSLEVKNNSNQPQDICIYQKPVNLALPGVLPVAWQTAAAAPHATVTFTWSLADVPPNSATVLTPHPEYWLTAGTFTPGELLDPSQIVTAIKVPFDGTFAMQAVLGPDNRWTVSAGDR